MIIIEEIEVRGTVSKDAIGISVKEPEDLFAETVQNEFVELATLVIADSEVEEEDDVGYHCRAVFEYNS